MSLTIATWLILDRDAGDLEGQVHRGIRERILAGRLADGSRLPSSRSLAAALGISRSTVVRSFERLRAEGYIEGLPGAATRVAILPRFPQAGHAPKSPPRLEFVAPSEPERALPFRPGVPDLSSFPATQWARCLSARVRSLRIHDLGYGASSGLLELRSAVLNHVSATRGVLAHADQVFILPSARSVIGLMAALLIEPGNLAWIEEPGYPAAHAVLRQAGARLVPVPCDDAGVDIAQGKGPPPRLIYVTPSHQYPTGATMSLPRRLALLDFAQVNGAIILEDDYDSEFHYSSRPIAALQGIDRGDCVAYIGTFSKVLAPGLRVAYAILPQGLAARAAALLRLRGETVSIHVQAAMADFLNDGHLRAHIRRMRSLYGDRMTCTVAALRARCEDLLQIGTGAGGLQLTARFRDQGMDDRKIATALHQLQIGAQALSDFYLEQPSAGLVFGIAQATPAQAIAAVANVERVMRT